MSDKTPSSRLPSTYIGRRLFSIYNDDDDDDDEYRNPMVYDMCGTCTYKHQSDYDIVIPDYSTHYNSQNQNENQNENNTFMIIDNNINNNEREMSFDSFDDENYSNLL
ncbi:Hypothetical protein EHI5A_102550 [Entamoeba histolytica KU27]|uniref:Uncharacterized protein n=1 Tax=Entamoeba histolytica KU27 TaxID=885311 RepID=M2Q8W4_ENTHI|nr:Hypothetical protein EHI5A_102550 [Entamoeba histolytica KU27]